MDKGSIAEIVSISVFSLAFLVLLIWGWKGKMIRFLSFQNDWIIIVSVSVFHAINLLFTLIGGYWHILPFILPFMAVHLFLIVFLVSRKKNPLEKGLVC